MKIARWSLSSVDARETESLVEVLVRRDVPATAPDLHLQPQAAFAVDRRDVHTRIADLDRRIADQIARRDVAGTLDVDGEDLFFFAVQLDRNLLEVQNDVGHVLLHSGDRGELVQDVVDLNRGDGCSLDRRKQAAAQGVSDRRGEAALERLCRELAVGSGQGLRFDINALGALESLPKHHVAPYESMTPP